MSQATKPALPTRFAPAERCSHADALRQHRQLRGALRTGILDMVPNIVLILNTCRQIVHANSGMLGMAGDAGLDSIIGLRPGEALGCIHARLDKSGCGTTEFCTQCGAAKAILGGLAGRKTVHECSILRRADVGEDALDLLVSATPLVVSSERYTTLAIKDISHEKRRRALEHVFFHDILTETNNIASLLKPLRQHLPHVLADDAELLHVIVSQLKDEIVSQTILLAAENNELSVNQMPMTAGGLLDTVAGTYALHPLAEGKTVVTDDASGNASFTSDATILRRILGNMLKNALEASSDGDTVRLGCRLRGDSIEFSVANPAVIRHEVQLQIFNRSFSTKGKGRGLGTYGMKMLTERYLNGEVSFSSTQTAGTVFRVVLPRMPAKPVP